MLGRAPRGARRGGWAGRGGAWAATLFFADFELLPGAPGRPGENDDWGRVCAPFWPRGPTAPRAQPGLNPALGAAGPPCGGWRIGRRGEAGKGLPLTVATGATIQALFYASCAPMSSVLGWAPGAHNAVAKFWRSQILRSAARMAISPLRTHDARLARAQRRVLAGRSRCSAGYVALWRRARHGGGPAGRARAGPRGIAGGPQEAARVSARGAARKRLGGAGVRRACRLQARQLAPI